MSANNDALPLGWGDRNNQMSEHDMKLGGMAATKFAKKDTVMPTNNAYADDTSGTYKSSDQVRDFYLSKISTTTHVASSASQSLPAGWESRQRSRDSEAKQYGVFSRNPPPVAATTAATTEVVTDDPNFRGPEVALLQIATQTLESLTSSLQATSSKAPVALTLQEKTDFANAVKNAMAALSNTTTK
uniref:Uncharacterized protein n=1 Tax=Craspedostauros australis TaxID=1486917 RepID=A0A7R9WTK7_9STRA